RIERDDMFPLCGGDSRISRGGKPSVFLIYYVIAERFQLAHHTDGRSIVRAIVHDDQLVQVARTSFYARYRIANVLPVVVARDNECDERVHQFNILSVQIPQFLCDHDVIARANIIETAPVEPRANAVYSTYHKSIIKPRAKERMIGNQTEHRPFSAV